MNPFNSNLQKKKNLVDEMNKAEAEFQSYALLCQFEIMEPPKRAALLSKDIQLEYSKQLPELRKKFWVDERSPIVDPMRPATLAEVKFEPWEILEPQLPPHASSSLIDEIAKQITAKMALKA